MSDRWLKPDFQEIAVAGECTAYAGTQGACEANNHSIITVDPLKQEIGVVGGCTASQLTTASSPWTH
jgi:hypothetical protein